MRWLTLLSRLVGLAVAGGGVLLLVVLLRPAPPSVAPVGIDAAPAVVGESDAQIQARRAALLVGSSCCPDPRVVAFWADVAAGP